MIAKCVIILGGGLVGALEASFMAKKGYDVKLFEKREDIRFAGLTEGRSINLALSNRGKRSLKKVGLEEEILKSSIPMHGRLLHLKSGTLKSVPYDSITHQHLNSISRNHLNLTLIKALEQYPNVQLYFKHNVIKIDLVKETVTVLNMETNDSKDYTADLIIGADGAYSTMRSEIQKSTRFSYSQQFIDHGYLELAISAVDGVKMLPNHLHIWPRGDFMMIALPNLNQSWTVTLFMSFKHFESLTTPSKLIDFFKKTFPDFLNYRKENDLIDDFFRKSAAQLISVKCDPYHHGNKFVLIGDAAHAMVPFYGQGMNSGFEDCALLDDLLEKFDIPKAIEEFSRTRKNDAHAICDLAIYNYIEMRDLVIKPSYIFRKKFDEAVHKLMPRTWVPLYNSVTFTNMGYEQCIKNRQWQNKVLIWIIVLISSLLVLFLSLFLGLNKE